MRCTTSTFEKSMLGYAGTAANLPYCYVTYKTIWLSLYCYLTFYLIAIPSTSAALRNVLSCAGGGNALRSKTDNAGQESSVRASAAVPNSQLKCLLEFILPRIYMSKRRCTRDRSPVYLEFTRKDWWIRTSHLRSLRVLTEHL
jgi:hypothetical protein